jgi:aminoglycoside phosphotransferase (APT) family kinase protein
MSDTGPATDWRSQADDGLVAAVETAFQNRTVSRLAGTGPSWNDQNQTVRVEFADGETAFLKVASDGDGSRVTRECAVTDYVREHAPVAVPDVLAADANRETPYLATAPLGDRSLRRQWGDADEDDRTGLAERVGRALAALHDHRFDAHGHVVGGGAGGLEVDEGPWTDVLVDRIEWMHTIAPADRFGYYYAEVADAVEANRDLLDGAPAALLHGDPAMPNCFPLAGGSVGFVDWELAHAGDPARELHRATNLVFADADGNAPAGVVDALHGGYRERAGGLPPGYGDREPVYDAVRYLGRVGFYEEWVDVVDEDPEALADRFETEMDARLDAVR